MLKPALRDRKPWRWTLIGSIFVVGCAGPLSQSMEDSLREQMLAAHRVQRDAADGESFTLNRQVSDVEDNLVKGGHIKELSEMAGPSAYENEELQLGEDLLGNPQTERVVMSLKSAVQLAARHNPDLEVARIVPAINDTQITQAEAAFDAVFFSNFNFQNQDTPQPDTAFTGFGSVQSDTRALETGIRKPLTTGGQVTLSTEFSRQFRDPSIFNVNKFTSANVLVNLQQPLLRNFGSDVVRSQVLLAKSAKEQSVEDLHERMLDVVQAVESNYWNLVLAQQRLLIQARLVKRTLSDRDIIAGRQDFDAGPAELTQANSFVEIRRADLIRAQQDIRLASDAVKRLINSPDLPLSGETLVLPADRPIEAPVTFNVLDAVTVAMRERPELKAALLQIKDSTIRQRVADNQRLPLLNLNAGVQYNGIGLDGADEAYNHLGEGKFIDYLLGLQFEQPIGNRAAEGLFRQRQLERRASVVNYQRLAQNAVLEVKDAMRNLITAFRLIDATRGARLAAANDLRVLESQIIKDGLRPDLVDRKLRSSAALASAELQEAQALIDYNVSLTNFHRAMGTLLKRNGILFESDLEEQAQAEID